MYKQCLKHYVPVMSYRTIDNTDYPLIRQAIDKWKTIIPLYNYCKKFNPEKIIANIYRKDTEGAAYIVGGSFLLLVTEGSPDYSDDLILQEDLILSLVPGGRLLDVVDALEDIAKVRGVDHIALSDSSIGIKLSSVYQRRRGYRVITHTLFKDL